MMKLNLLINNNELEYVCVFKMLFFKDVDVFELRNFWNFDQKNKTSEE